MYLPAGGVFEALSLNGASVSRGAARRLPLSWLPSTKSRLHLPATPHAATARDEWIAALIRSVEANFMARAAPRARRLAHFLSHLSRQL